MGFSAGSVACIAVIGILSLLLGRFVRKIVLPKIMEKMFDREKVDDMLGVRGARALSLAIALVFFVEFIERSYHRNSANELWDQAEFEQIFGLGLFEHLVVHGSNFSALTAKTK